MPSIKPRLLLISTLMTANQSISLRGQKKKRFYQITEKEMLGINLRYEIQKSPDGIAQAFIIGEKFLSQDKCALILGDNIFYGANLDKLLKHASNQQKGSTIFTYRVDDPERYGVVEFDKEKVISIEEKPIKPSQIMLYSCFMMKML